MFIIILGLREIKGDKGMFKLVTAPNGVRYYISDKIENTGLVRHGFTTRAGGVSSGCYSSLNLRFNCDDSRENVLENYRLAAEAIGISPRSLVLSCQVHEDNVLNASAEDRGNGIWRDNRFKSADGLVTNEYDTALVTHYADCVPILMVDRNTGAVASVHSGWKGTVKRIAAKAALKLAEDYGGYTGDIIAAIGPSIRIDHFEVGDEVAEQFIDEFGCDAAKKFGEKYHVDMQQSIIKSLVDVGVKRENIDDSEICTYCECERLYSHRASHGKRGTHGAIISKIRKQDYR